MSITQKLMGLGGWRISLGEDAPDSLLDDIDFLTHIVVTDSPIDTAALSDNTILNMARYVGVIVHKPTSLNFALQGYGLLWWLGDDADRGFILYDTNKQEFTNESFNQAITDILAVVGSPITKGTVETPAGTFTQTFDLVTQRKAIEEVCAAFGAEYVVRNDFTLDAGASGFIFDGSPSAIIVRKEMAGGTDPVTEGLAVEVIDVVDDVEDWVSKTIVAGSGTGDATTVVDDDLVTIPYTDPQGNDVVRGAVWNEARLETTEATTRASELLSYFGTNRKTVAIDLTEYDVLGDFEVGDLIYVYDPTTGLTDSSNELEYRGQIINPIAIRCVGKSAPVTKDFGVYHRDASGNYTDLTNWVNWEQGGTTIEVGASRRNLAQNLSEVLESRITTDPNYNDGITPQQVVVENTPWTGVTYIDAQGTTKSSIVADWTQPLDGDGGTIDDGAYYAVRYAPSGTSQYSYMNVPWSATIVEITDLSPGVTYAIQIAAVDNKGNQGPWSVAENVSAPNTVNAPSQPAAPTVAGNPLRVQVVHDLSKQGGGDLEDDVEQLNVYADKTSGFTPSDANKLGTIAISAGSITLGIDAIGDFPAYDTDTLYFVVTAVNKAGLESTKSIEATVSAELVDTQHVADLFVTTAKIDDLAVSTAKIALLAVDTAQIADAAIETAKIGDLEVTNAKVAADLNATKITAGTLDADRIAANSITPQKWATGETGSITITIGTGGKIQSTDADPDVVINGNGSATFKNVTITGTVNADTGYLDTLNIQGTLTMVSGGLIKTAGSGERIELGYTAGNLPAITFHDSSGNSDAYIQYLNGVSMTVGTNDGKPLNIDSDGHLYLIAGTSDEVFIQPNAGTSAVAISSSRARFYDPIYGADGSAGAPMFTFNSDTNTGMYRQGEGIIGFSINSTTRLSITSTGADVSGKLYGMDNGSVTAPSIYWGTDSNTGLWRITENYLGLAAGAVTLMQWGYTGSNRELYMYGLPSMSNNYVRWNSSNNLVGYSTSTLRIKKDIEPAPVGLTDSLKPSVFKYRRDDEIEDGQREDETEQYFHVAEDEWDTEHIGLIAEWTAEVDDRLAIYQGDDPIPVNYEVESILALVVADLQDARKRIAELEMQLAA